MNYKTPKVESTSPSNVEFMLLQIIAQCGEISGYRINRLVEEREYRVWAGIGTTSVYTGLARLARKGLVRSRLDMAKKGKGPLPRRFRLTAKGQRVLREEIRRGLSSTREGSRRFDLALAAVPLLARREITRALERRKRFLGKAATHVAARFKAIGGERLPINIKALFKHSLHGIRRELQFMDVLLRDVKKTKRGKEARR
jgi:DNA-binding PadR family transcriptional regulator